MAKNSAQAQTEKPEAQKGGAAKMPIFPTKFDGSGSDNTDEFRRTLTGHLELQGTAASFYKASQYRSTAGRMPPSANARRRASRALAR